MAISFLSHVVADLALGKPSLSFLPTTASIQDALQALHWLGDDVSEIGVWQCSPSESFLLGHEISQETENCIQDPESQNGGGLGILHVPQHCLAHAKCVCVGKVRMQEIICYLGRDENLRDLGRAFRDPVTTLLTPNCPTVLPIDPHASILDALELMVVKDAQNLVVPIMGRRGGPTRSNSLTDDKHVKTLGSTGMGSAPKMLSKSHGGKEYCWLTQEDVLRFMLGSIAIFSPLPVTSIQDLGIIRTDVKNIEFQKHAAMALEMIMSTRHHMLPIAVVDRSSNDRENTKVKLIGDISSCSLRACNETAALALATLSAGDFVVYTQDCKNPPDVLVDLIRSKIFEKMPGERKEDDSKQRGGLEMWEDLSSDDDDSGVHSPTGPYELSKWHYRSFRVGSSGTKNRSGPIFCNPRSSLIAVLLQALAHRENYVWVTREDDDTLVGVVTFLDILTLMFNHINAYRK